MKLNEPLASNVEWQFQRVYSKMGWSERTTSEVTVFRAPYRNDFRKFINNNLSYESRAVFAAKQLTLFSRHLKNPPKARALGYYFEVKEGDVRKAVRVLAVRQVLK